MCVVERDDYVDDDVHVRISESNPTQVNNDRETKGRVVEKCSQFYIHDF